MTTRPRCYAYIRVSTSRQQLSPEAQRDTITKCAASLGKTIDQWFQDAPIVRKNGKLNDAVSGGVAFLKRKAGRELHDHLREGDILFISRLDRGFRGTKDAVNCHDIWKRMGVRLIICDFPGIDMTSPMGELVFTILAAVAQFEKALIRERTREALDAKRREGWVFGVDPPYGFAFAKSKDPQSRKWVRVLRPDPEERAVMGQIAAYYEQKCTTDEIVAFLAAAEIRTRAGRPWRRARVYRAWRAERELRLKETQVTSTGATDAEAAIYDVPLINPGEAHER